jgi:lysophospholipase L1-like esterase
MPMLDSQRSPASEVAPARFSRARTRLKKLALGWIVVLLLAALLEGGARLLVAPPVDTPLWIPTQANTWQRSPIHVADHDLFWRNRANVDVMFRGNHVVTNAFGMRSPPISQSKAPGVIRILCLGESTTFGERVEQDQTYAAVLEKRLNARGDGHRYEVLNAGAPGYTIVQSAEYLSRCGLDFDPDVILVYHGFNDFLPTNFLAQRIGSGAVQLSDLSMLERRHRLDQRVSAWLVGHSLILQWVHHLLEPTAAPQGPVAETLPQKNQEAVRVPALERRTMLVRMQELARSHGATLIILVPCYGDFTDHRDLLLGFAREHGVPAIDMEDAIERAGGERRSLFADRVHPGARLHEAMADEIAAYLASHPLRSPGFVR